MQKLFRNLTTRQTIAKNAFWLFAAQVVNRGLRFVLVFVAARLLGPNGYGSFSYALSAATLMFVFADWGVGVLVMREYERTRDRASFLRVALGAKTILIAAFSLLGIVGWFAIENPAARGAYLVLIGLMALTQLRDFFIYVMRARQEMEREFVSITSESAVTLIVALLLLMVWPTTMALASAYLIGMLTSFVISIRLVPYPRLPSFAWGTGTMRGIFHAGASLAAFSVLSSFLFSADQVVLGHFRMAAEVGWYALATRIVLIELVLPQVGVMALFPYLVRVAGSRRSRQVAIITTVLLVVAGAAVALGTNLLAGLLVRIIGGVDFLPTIPILKHLSWISVLIFPVAFLDYYLIARGWQVANAIVTGIALATNLIINLVIVPEQGVTGAVLAALIAQGVNLLLTGGLALAALRHEGRTDPAPASFDGPTV